MHRCNNDNIKAYPKTTDPNNNNNKNNVSKQQEQEEPEAKNANYYS
jgi:hypothetical protein